MSDACSPDPRFDAATMAVDARPGLAFAGSGLDRAAYLRGDAAALERMAADPAARILPFWRGRPLLAGEEAAADPVLGAGLAGLAPEAELLSHMTGGLIFLGLSGGAIAVMLVTAALPVGANVLLFTQRYGAMQDEVSSAIAISTALALLTLPVMLALAQLLRG